MSSHTCNVLFLCTRNSARSIMAESILNEVGRDRFCAYSAGSHPNGRVNPLALELLRENRISVEHLRSKSWDEFAKADAPKMDLVITVCDNAAGEVCPLWPGQPMTAHWGVPDPAAATGTSEVQRKAFRDACHSLLNRIRILASLPVEKLDRMSLQSKVREIGKAP